MYSKLGVAECTVYASLGGGEVYPHPIQIPLLRDV